MKKLVTLLLLYFLLFGLVACGGEKTQNSSNIPSAGTSSAETAKVANYEIGDIVDFGDYKWKVLDIKDNKALLLTDEIIALDYINITEEATEAIDDIGERYPDLYQKLSDYEGWTIFMDDELFSEGDSFYDSWCDLIEKDFNITTLDPYNLRTSVNWADCSLRNKLNTEMRFSDEEWSQIVETEVSTSTDDGEVIYDKVFLLTSEQVERYFPRTEDRGAKGTGLSEEDLLHYLKSLHIVGDLSGALAEFALDLPNGGTFYWWAIGENSNDLMGVHVGTDEQLSIIAPALSIAGVRPAIWVYT